MTITYSSFFPPTVVGTVATLLLTVPATPTSTLLRGGRIRFANVSGAAVTLAAFAVPSAGAPGAGNAFLNGKSINANDFLDIDVPIMPPGSTVQAIAGTAASINAHMISGGLYS